MNIVLAHIVPEECIHCPAKEPRGNELVESCSNDTDPDVLCNQFSFK